LNKDVRGEEVILFPLLVAVVSAGRGEGEEGGLWRPSYPALVPVHAEHLVLVGGQVVEGRLPARGHIVLK